MREKDDTKKNSQVLADIIAKNMKEIANLQAAIEVISVAEFSIWYVRFCFTSLVIMFSAFGSPEWYVLED